MRPRRLFIAGSTGATGRAVVRIARSRFVDVVPHARPGRKRPLGLAAGSVELELSDRPKLVDALRGCTTVVQLIGTMRSRFAAGDTYETSDIGTTAELAAAASEAGIDHFLLLSSVGAGRPVGAYLAAKAAAERIVVEGAIPYTIFRPSALVGEGRGFPVAALLSRVALLGRFRPIPIEWLAAAMLRVAMRREPLGVALEGAGLWREVDAARTREAASGPV